MGRIKTALIKRTAQQLIEKNPELFSTSFEENKQALKGVFPSKRMRNIIAGYITRLKKNTHKIIKDDQ